MSIETAPLTILAGANSSGKSSILQPLLLLKQTLEASYDPGALLLSGPNVNFTSASQLLSRIGKEKADVLEVSVACGDRLLKAVFRRAKRAGLEIESTQHVTPENGTITISPRMTHAAIQDTLPKLYKDFYGILSKGPVNPEAQVPGIPSFEWAVIRERCFLEPQLVYKREENDLTDPVKALPVPFLPSFASAIANDLKSIIHLPGLRGNPERTYPVTAVESSFPGTFQTYTASVIRQWQLVRDHRKLETIGKQLEHLGLSWRVMARPVQDAQVEIRVSRLPHRSRAASDFVSIADVGLGLSQVLPLVVALNVASSGQMVYLEQPEIHLHPRAQSKFAEVVVSAINRGVKVLLETHSSLILLGIQTAVAEGVLSREFVRLHWFQRDQTGVTQIRSAALDETGAFGDWPEDFGDVSLRAEGRYLDAADQSGAKVH